MTTKESTYFNLATTTIPLYITQGGGYATNENGLFVWLTGIPDFVNAQVGDPIPEEWGVVSVNEAAFRQEDEQYYQE